MTARMNVSKLLFPSFFLAIIILVGYGFYDKIEEKKAIYNINYHTEKELYVINSPWFFKKPGISVLLLQLKDSDIQFFKSPPADFFSSYPQLPSSSYKKWKIIKWKNTPFYKADSQYVKFALADTEDDFFLEEDVLPDLIQTLHFVSSIISESGNYYAILYKIDSDRKYSVDLFLVSPKRKLLVEIKRR